MSKIILFPNRLEDFERHLENLKTDFELEKYSKKEYTKIKETIDEIITYTTSTEN